jgi:hypothetical protein
MTTNTLHDVDSAWLEIRGWPPGKRLTLASRILQSLEQDSKTPDELQQRREALQQLIGIWKTHDPPRDEEVERIVEEERMKKYG